MSSDITMLLEMGFEKERAEMAMKQANNLQDAIEWLEKNQDKSTEEITTKKAESPTSNISTTASAVNEVAQSLKCGDCGKMFRTHETAQFHAEKSGHANFEESTEEIKPLTKEEMDAKLEEMRQKLQKKKAAEAIEERSRLRKAQQIRRTVTTETQNAKEELQITEMRKQAMLKRREKLEDREALKRAQAKIQEDKLERKCKAELEKAQRTGQLPPSSEPSAPVTVPGKVISQPSSAYQETRLRLQTPEGMMIKTFPANATLFDVCEAIGSESKQQVQSFMQNFPRKEFDVSEFETTLKEAGMVPSAALVVKYS